MAYIAKV